MQRRTLFLAALGMMAGFTLSAAQADTLTRAAAGATRVHFNLPGELIVRHGDTEQVVVQAEPQVLERLVVTQKGDALTLASSGSFRTEKPIRVTLTLKNLQGLKLANSGSATVEQMRGRALEVEARGSGNLVLSGVDYQSVQAELASSGRIAISGTGQSLRATIGGSGTIAAADFAARTVEAAIKGAGEIQVHAKETLKASISGAGNIAYRGNPTLTSSVSGAGSVGRL